MKPLPRIPMTCCSACHRYFVNGKPTCWCFVMQNTVAILCLVAILSFVIGRLAGAL